MFLRGFEGGWRYRIVARFSHSEGQTRYGGYMIFSRRMRSQEHIKSFVVDEADDRGWEVREEEDHHIVKRTWMRDWHRVENAMMLFGLQATQLQRAGWVEVSNVV